MEGFCSTCLSRDRRMTSISTKYLEQLFNLKLNWLHSYTDICWECWSTVHKCVRFRATAHSAHITLDNWQHYPQLPRDSIQSLSSLAVKLNSVDQEIHYEDPIKTEKKEDTLYPDYEFRDTKSDIQLDDFEDDNIINEAFAQDGDSAECPTNPIEIKTEPKEHDEPKESCVVINFNTIQVSLEELNKLRAALRRKKDYTSAKYKCETCVRHFATGAEFRRHRQGRHSELAGRHICTICNQRFLQADLLSDHYRGHFTCYVCKTCGFTHTSQDEARGHSECSHCKLPGRRVRKPASNTEDKTYECTICSIAFATIKRLSYHNCTVHKPLKRCDKCGKKYANNDSLKKHMQHFKSAYYYRRHIRYNWRHRSEAVMKYQCDECGKKFMSKKYVSNHIETVHVRRLNYACAACGKRYTSHASLGAHTRKHHSAAPKRLASPNVCEICGKSFKLKKCLSEHMNTHTGARPFVCSVCGDAFAYSSVLYTHNRLKHLHLKARGKADAKEVKQPKEAKAVHAAPQDQDAGFGNAQFFRTFLGKQLN